MGAMAYKIGGVAFDDKSLLKVLTLPSDADDDTPVTFHDSTGSNYQVPIGKVFIAGLLYMAILDLSKPARIGESDAADGGIITEVLFGLTAIVTGTFIELNVLGVFSAEKYVTGGTTSTAASDALKTNSTIYGIEIDA